MSRLLALLLLISLSISAAAAANKPNILVIVADDLGYSDIGAHGGKAVPTPNIDALAASGVRCTSGYVSSPYCSPSRAGFLTGRYQTRFGHEFNPHDHVTHFRPIAMQHVGLTELNRQVESLRLFASMSHRHVADVKSGLFNLQSQPLHPPRQRQQNVAAAAREIKNPQRTGPGVS